MKKTGENGRKNKENRRRLKFGLRKV